MAKDPEQLTHLEWLGYVQPVGLVVSIPALLSAQAQINRNIAPAHQRFLSCLPRDRRDDVIAEIRDFSGFTQHVLGWEAEDLIPIPDVSTLPDDFRDEVLARLLDLNTQRAEQERLAGLTAEATTSKSKGRRKKSVSALSTLPGLVCEKPLK